MKSLNCSKHYYTVLHHIALLGVYIMCIPCKSTYEHTHTKQNETQIAKYKKFE